MKLKAYVQSCGQDFTEINKLLKEAKVEVSFWGTRKVTVEELQGSISLDQLAQHVFLAAGQCSSYDDFPANQRVAGIAIMKTLRSFYKITDTKISQANLFTKGLNYLREFTFIPYTPRFHTEEGLMENYFRGYSESSFKREFGDLKKPGRLDYENSDGSFGPPLRIMAKEEAIQKLLV